jgi:hypothetical protein
MPNFTESRRRLARRYFTLPSVQIEGTRPRLSGDRTDGPHHAVGSPKSSHIDVIEQERRVVKCVLHAVNIIREARPAQDS